MEVSLSFVSASSAFKGAFSAPSMRLIGLPLSAISLSEGAVHFELMEDVGSTAFEGTLTGDSLMGRFHGAKGEGEFSASRVDERHLPYGIEDANFSNGPVKLSGTLLLPNRPGRHPAVIFLHGAGPEGRYASLYLADHLARLGVASLIYDKRGVGESTGDWRGSGFKELAGDAAAGLALLKSHPMIESGAIGTFGFSQAGFVSPLVAELSPNLRFLVVVAAYGGVAYQQDLFRIGSRLRESTFSDEERSEAEEFYRRFVAVAKSGEGIEQFWAEAEKVHGERWFSWLEIPPRDHWVWDYYRLIGDFDPLPLWRKVRVPTLLVYGQRDRLVSIDENLSKISSALAQAGNTDYGAVILPRAGHDLTLERDPGEPFRWPQVAPGFADLVAGWVLLQASRSAPVSSRPEGASSSNKSWQ